MTAAPDVNQSKCSICSRNVFQLPAVDSVSSGDPTLVRPCALCIFKRQFEATDHGIEFIRNLKRKTERISYPFSLVDSDEVLDTQSIGTSFFDKRLIVSKQSSEYNNPIQPSKRPIICNHRNCNKYVAASKLLIHYKFDHRDVHMYTFTRRQQFSIRFEAKIVEYQTSVCLGILNVYEQNEIDVTHSKSSISVIRACKQFSRPIPMNTFWLMVTGSVQYNQRGGEFFTFWLYSNTCDEYWYVLELSDDKETMTTGITCRAVVLHEIVIPPVLNCLCVARDTLLEMLTKGTNCVLNITVL